MSERLTRGDDSEGFYPVRVGSGFVEVVEGLFLEARPRETGEHPPRGYPLLERELDPGTGIDESVGVKYELVDVDPGQITQRNGEES